MKLNKKGWGFIEFFAFLLIFVVCLIAVFFMLDKIGLLDDDYKYIKDYFEPEDVQHVSYAELKIQMVDATKKYIKDFYDNQLGVDTLNIRVSQLIDNNYLDKLEDSKGRDCSGYVSVYLDRNNTIQYDAYLKCKDYESDGYEERKDD